MRPPDPGRESARGQGGRLVDQISKLPADHTTVPAALAAQINAEHERAFGKAREALEHARRAGELLRRGLSALASWCAVLFAWARP